MLRRWGLTLAVFFIFNELNVPMQALLGQRLFVLFRVSFVPFMWLFLLGAMCAEYFESWIGFLKKNWILFLLLLLPAGFLPDPGFYHGARCVLIFLAILGFSYSYPEWNLRTDISYGLYLYHMVIVNIFIELGATERIPALILCFFISCACGYLSARVNRVFICKSKR